MLLWVMSPRVVFCVGSVSRRFSRESVFQKSRVLNLLASGPDFKSLGRYRFCLWHLYVRWLQLRQKEHCWQASLFMISMRMSSKLMTSGTLQLSLRVREKRKPFVYIPWLSEKVLKWNDSTTPYFESISWRSRVSRKYGVSEILGPASLAAATTNLALRYMAQFLDHQEYKVNWLIKEKQRDNA